MKTTANSSLMWRVCKVHYISDKYVKARLMFFYKSSKDCCYWLNPTGSPKNFKITREAFNEWGDYELNT